MTEAPFRRLTTAVQVAERGAQRFGSAMRVTTAAFAASGTRGRRRHGAVKHWRDLRRAHRKRWP